SIPLLVGLTATILAIRDRREARARQRDRQDAREAATALPEGGQFLRPSGLPSEPPTAIQPTRPVVPRGKRLCPHCKKLLTLYAVKCRYCKSVVEGSEALSPRAAEQSAAADRPRD